MTYDEIMKCRPGKSMDMLVAEACRIRYERRRNPSGLHQWDEVGSSMYNGTYRCAKCLEHETNGAYGDEPLPKDGCKPSPILFQPSIDWNDAMRAAKKFANGKSYHVDFDLNYGKDKLTGWDCVFDGHSWSLFAATGPLAICRAILLNARSKESES
jgi:hypothetical protein